MTAATKLIAAYEAIKNLKMQLQAKGNYMATPDACIIELKAKLASRDTLVTELERCLMNVTKDRDLYKECALDVIDSIRDIASKTKRRMEPTSGKKLLRVIFDDWDALDEDDCKTCESNSQCDLRETRGEKTSD